MNLLKKPYRISARFASPMILLGASVFSACTADLRAPGGSGDDRNGLSSSGDGDGDGDGDSDVAGVGAMGSGAPGTGGGGTSTVSPLAPDAARGGLRRLTPAQYHRALTDLLGNIGEPYPIEGLPAGAELLAVSASTTAVTTKGVEDFEKATDAALDAVFADATRGQELVGCASATWDAPCATEFINRFGRRAFRRPITPEELTRYLGLGEIVTTETRSFTDGARAITSALLQSPHFLYRVELGEPGVAETSLTAFEKASRISFLLWGVTPDDTLLDAAASGALDTKDGRATQVARLLQAPDQSNSLGLPNGIDDLASDLLALDSVFMMTRDTELFPELTPTLRQAMRDEMVLLFQDIAMNGSEDLLQLFDTRTTFVNEELGALYGIDVTGPTLQKATHPDGVPRSGILTAALILSAHDKRTETSPTRRGAFISSAFSCVVIPDPPPGIETALPEPPEGVVLSRRERLGDHVANPVCANCHDLMDPVGLSLENFDALGRYRTTDEYALTIDATGEFEGVPYGTPAELGPLMRASEQVRECFVRRIYSYATGRIQNEFDSVQVERLTGALPAGQIPFRQLMTDLLTSDELYEISSGTP